MYELYRRADYKQMITIKRPDQMSQDAFMDWWFDHAEKMKRLPGLRWYTILFSLQPSPFGSPAFDGFEELWFESLDALKGAYATRTMQRELENIRKHEFDDPSRFQGAWLEENVVTIKGSERIPDKKGMVRLTGICKLPPTMKKKDLKGWFYQHAARVIDADGRMVIPGIRWYTHSFALDNSPFGVSPFYGCAENWWDSLEEMKRDLMVR